MPWTWHPPRRTAQVARRQKAVTFAVLVTPSVAPGPVPPWCSTHRQPARSGGALVPVRRARITQIYEGTNQIQRERPGVDIFHVFARPGLEAELIAVLKRARAGEAGPHGLAPPLPPLVMLHSARTAGARAPRGLSPRTT